MIRRTPPISSSLDVPSPNSGAASLATCSASVPLTTAKYLVSVSLRATASLNTSGVAPAGLRLRRGVGIGNIDTAPRTALVNCSSPPSVVSSIGSGCAADTSASPHTNTSSRSVCPSHGPSQNPVGPGFARNDSRRYRPATGAAGFMRVCAPAESNASRSVQFVRSCENCTNPSALVQYWCARSTSVNLHGRLKSNTAVTGLQPLRPTVFHSGTRGMRLRSLRPGTRMLWPRPSCGLFGASSHSM